MVMLKILFSNKHSVVSSCKNCSFEYVAQLIKRYMKKYYNKDFYVDYKYSSDTTIVIDDLWHFAYTSLADFAPHYAVYWVDTAWVAQTWAKPNPALGTYTVATTSQWNANLLHNMGVNALIIPRAIDEDTVTQVFDPHAERDIDMLVLSTVSSPQGHDKKETKLAYRVAQELGLKAYFICKFDFCQQKPFTLSDEDKFKLMRRSKFFWWLTWSEGFGMPPVEAMAVGTPILYNNSEYVAQYLRVEQNVGITPMAIDLMEDPTVRNHYFPHATYNYNDVLRGVKEILSREYTPEDRLKLHDYVMTNFSHKNILPRLINLIQVVNVI